MARYLGIDYGLERTGLAFADGETVLPVKTLFLAQCGSRKAFLDSMAALAEEKGADAVIMGLPLAEDGSESMTCTQIRNAAERLRRRISVPLYFMPEAFSSYEAEAMLRKRGLKRKKLRAVLDQMAACRILSSWLARQKMGA